MDNIRKMYIGVNGYNPYKFNVTTNSHKWIGYVALALAVIALRFLCCA